MSIALPSLPEEHQHSMSILPSLPAMDHGFDEDDDEDKNNISSLPPTQEHVFDDESHDAKKPITFSAFENEVSSSSSEDDEQEDEFADHPDPLYLNQLSDHKISKHQLARLPAWSFLICIDRLDRKTWKLPYRDGLGRLNRPFLTRAREVLTSRKLVEEMGIALDQETRAHALQCFARAWPGQPCTLVQAMNQPIVTASVASTQLVVSTEDLLARGDALLQASRPAKRKSALQAAANIQSAPAVLSDAAPNLLMKLDMRLKQQQQKRPLLTAAKPAVVVAVARTNKYVDLRLLAKQKLAQKREHKSKIGRAVEEEYRVPTPPPPPQPEEEEEEEKPKEGDEDDDENDSDFVPGEDSDDEDEDKEKEEQPVNGEPVDDEEEAQFGGYDAAPTQDEEEEEEESNAKYRAMLEVDARLAASNNNADNNRFVENQAEEEEEDAILKERVIGQADSDDDDEDEGDLRVTEEDLRGIVDVAKDDTEQGRNQVLSLFQQQQEDADATLENKLSRDLKNHTLIASRKRMHASKLDRAMMEDDSGEETDEEQEMAKMLRFERETQSALDALQSTASLAGAQSSEALDEEEEEIRRELEQAQGFLKRSLTLKRQLSSSRSGAITPSLDSFSSQILEQDEDTKAVWEGLNSASTSMPAQSSNAAMEGVSSNSMSLFLQELKTPNAAATANKRARGLFASSSAAASSSRGIASLSRAFVYTKNVSASSQPLPSSSQQSNEDGGDAARSGFEPISASQGDGATPSINAKKRRVALKAVPIGSLPIAKLLEPNRMQQK